MTCTGQPTQMCVVIILVKLVCPHSHFNKSPYHRFSTLSFGGGLSSNREKTQLIYVDSAASRWILPFATAPSDQLDLLAPEVQKHTAVPYLEQIKGKFVKENYTLRTRLLTVITAY